MHVPSFDGYCDRPPFTSEKNPPDAKRFEIFNRSPDVLSKNKHMYQVTLDKLTPRDITKTLLPPRDCLNEYENAVP